jgi:hypothetical protein
LSARSAAAKASKLHWTEQQTLSNQSSQQSERRVRSLERRCLLMLWIKYHDLGYHGMWLWSILRFVYLYQSKILFLLTTNGGLLWISFTEGNMGQVVKNNPKTILQRNTIGIGWPGVAGSCFATVALFCAEYRNPFACEWYHIYWYLVCYCRLGTTKSSRLRCPAVAPELKLKDYDRIASRWYVRTRHVPSYLTESPCYVRVSSYVPLRICSSSYSSYTHSITRREHRE